MFGEEGEVIAGDAAIVVGGALVAGAEEGFGFGELAAFGEECAEGSFQREAMGGDFEGFTDAEFGGVVKLGCLLDEWDAGELIEEGGFLLIGNDVWQEGGACGFKAAIVLEHDGVKPFA